jgi:hypothetical protein
VIGLVGGALASQPGRRGLAVSTAVLVQGFVPLWWVWSGGAVGVVVVRVCDTLLGPETTGVCCLPLGAVTSLPLLSSFPLGLVFGLVVGCGVGGKQGRGGVGVGGCSVSCQGWSSGIPLRVRSAGCWWRGGGFFPGVWCRVGLCFWLLFEICIVDASIFFVAKFFRAHGGCLGIRSR